MQFKLSIATVLLALTSSTIAILPPRPTHFPPPFWSNPRLNDGRIRPAVCSSNRNSALYCGPRYAGSGYDKRAPVWAGPDGKFKDGMIRPAVCSSNPNSPLYCPGVRTAYNHKRSPQFNIQVCTPDPSGQRHCLENYRSDRWRLTRPQQKRSPQFRAQVCTPDPTGQRRCLENRIRPSPIWDLFKQPIGTISHGVGKRSQVMPTTSLDRIREMYRQQAIRNRCRHLWGTKKYAECHRGSQKRHHYGKSKNKKPRMMVCSFDKKNPNYCPGLEKDTEKVDERKGGRKSFFA